MPVRARDVQIRRPCPVELDPSRTRGGNKSWYCGHCEKSVHVLSNMTEGEARDFLGARVGQDLCVTYAVRRDGSIRFAAEEPAPKPRDRVVPITALTRRRSVAAAGFGLALAACAPHDNPDVEGKLRIADPPVTYSRTAPIIPDAPKTEPPPDELLMDGDIGPLEDLVDGELAEPMIPGGMIVEPLPPAGGISVEPLPPEPAAARGGTRAVRSRPAR